MLVIRMVDDFTLVSDQSQALAAAYATLQTLLSQVGLELNASKTGAFSHAEPPDPGLPTGPVRWNLLELRPDLTWQLSEAGFEQLLAKARRDLESEPLFSAVRRFNQHLRFTLASTMAAQPLILGGFEAHRRLVARALTRLEAECVPEGLIAHLEHKLSSRAAPSLPHAFYHWPITAGGLGLIDARLELGMLELEPLDVVSEPGSLEELETKSQAWGAWYHAPVKAPKLKSPREDAITKALREAFIERGKRLSAGEQAGLTPYWSWVLVVHGPSILEAFGSYAFVDERLLPLDLVLSGNAQGQAGAG